MPLELWETADLLEVTYNDGAAPPDGFWLGMFPRVHQSQSQKIVFDDLPKRDRRLAPFVASNVQGRVMGQRPTAIKDFAPAYVKPKHVVDPSKALTRMPNEPLGALDPGTMTLEARFDAHVANNVRTERELIERRWDWMACQAAAYGEVVVKGEDYPTTVVGFGRDPSLTVTLAGLSKWDAEGADSALADIGLARTRAFGLGRAPVNRLIFGLDAWTAFSTQPTVLKLLDNMRRGSESNFNTTGLTDGSPMEYMGQISGPNGAGRLELWTYSNDYEQEDETGVTEVIPYLDSRDVIGLGGAMQGVRCFGAIMDKRAGLRSMPIFPKMYEVEDPSVVYTLSQSAPLMVPINPNNTFRIRAL